MAQKTNLFRKNGQKGRKIEKVFSKPEISCLNIPETDSLTFFDAQEKGLIALLGNVKRTDSFSPSGNY
jgi:hypothetical protein